MPTRFATLAIFWTPATSADSRPTRSADLIRVSVRVHPGAKRDEVRRLDGESLEVWTRARPIDGRANEAVCRLVADFVHVPPSLVRLVGGARSRVKLIELDQ